MKPLSQETVNVTSPANIAFIKYWGQRDSSEVLPENDSFSMNLSGCTTSIQLTLTENIETQEVKIRDYATGAINQASPEELAPIVHVFELLRKKYSLHNAGFSINSANSFPKKAGIASSASFFSGLVTAFLAAYNVSETERERTILARKSGSGSAARSIPDGFVWWYKGNEDADSYAESIAGPDYWDLVDIVVLVSKEEKQTGSQKGHSGAHSSLLFPARQFFLNHAINDIKEAFRNRDIEHFGTIIEADAVSMHSVMMTQDPQLFFWNGTTLDLLRTTLELRSQGIPVYATIDAGANVHLISTRSFSEKIINIISTRFPGIDTIYNEPSVGTRIIGNRNY